MPRESGGTDYEVGYGKPPEATRFRKGVSGNPKGRPKGSKNIARMLRDAGSELVQITRTGRTKKVTLLEAGILQMHNKAAGGDSRAMREVLSAHRVFVEPEDESENQDHFTERDRTVMKSLLKRIQSTNSRGDQ